MKRLWPVLLVMFMLCFWSAVPVANATPTDIKTPSITNLVSPDILTANVIAPVDSVASVDVPAYAAVIAPAGLNYAEIRCCSSTVASYRGSVIPQLMIQDTKIENTEARLHLLL